MIIILLMILTLMIILILMTLIVILIVTRPCAPWQTKHEQQEVLIIQIHKYDNDNNESSNK